MKTGSDKKKGLIQFFRSLEPLFGLDNKPCTQNIERRAKVVMTREHKDFDRLVAYLKPILGESLVKKVQLVSAEYTSGPKEVHSYVEIEIQ